MKAAFISFVIIVLFICSCATHKTNPAVYFWHTDDKNRTYTIERRYDKIRTAHYEPVRCGEHSSKIIDLYELIYRKAQPKNLAYTKK